MTPDPTNLANHKKALGKAVQITFELDTYSENVEGFRFALDVSDEFMMFIGAIADEDAVPGVVG